MERLQKFISRCGYASRRKAEELIIQGNVRVNGEVVKILGSSVNENDVVSVNGETLNIEDKVTYVLNKPRGIVSTTSDEHGRKTVVDLIPGGTKLYPIGRLDYDTTGIILLTNDGELANGLTHPKNDVYKEYVAKVEGFFKKEDALKLSKGIRLDGKMTKEALFKLKKYDKRTNSSYVRVVLSEGRNHQVKDMFQFLGYNVSKLTRKKYAFLDLDGLKSGDYRKLNIKEVKTLYSLIK